MAAAVSGGAARRACLSWFKGMPRNLGEAAGVFRFAAWSCEELGVRMPPASLAAASYRQAKQVYAACCAWAWKLPGGAGALARWEPGKPGGPRLLGMRCPVVHTDLVPFDPREARRLGVPRFADFPMDADGDPFGMDGARDKALARRPARLPAPRPGMPDKRMVEALQAEVREALETPEERVYHTVLESDLIADVERLGGWRFWAGTGRSGALEWRDDARAEDLLSAIDAAMEEGYRRKRFQAACKVVRLAAESGWLVPGGDAVGRFALAACWLDCRRRAFTSRMKAEVHDVVVTVGNDLENLARECLGAARPPEDGGAAEYEERRRLCLLEDLWLVADATGTYWTTLVPAGARDDFKLSLALRKSGGRPAAAGKDGWLD